MYAWLYNITYLIWDARTHWSWEAQVAVGTLRCTLEWSASIRGRGQICRSCRNRPFFSGFTHVQPTRIPHARAISHMLNMMGLYEVWCLLAIKHGWTIPYIYFDFPSNLLWYLFIAFYGWCSHIFPSKARCSSQPFSVSPRPSCKLSKMKAQLGDWKSGAGSEASASIRCEWVISV